MTHTIFDERRAILLDEPEPNPYTVARYELLAQGLERRAIDPHDPYLVAPVGQTAVLLPMLAMVYHHVAQGWLNDRPWLAAFCCLCNAGTLFDPRLRGQVHTFAAQGYYDVMVLLADQQTQSYWNHLTGTCLYGPLAGATLERLDALIMMTAGEALAAYPDAQVAVIDSMTDEEKAIAERWNQVYRLPVEPAYGEGLLRTIADEDNRLPRHDMGLGIWTPTTQRYYSITWLYQQQGVIVDEVDGQRVAILLDEEVGLPVALYADASGVEKHGDEFIFSSGARYRKGLMMVNGQFVRPPRPNHNVIRWYAFAAIFPDCEIYGR
jgi:hypothetical protein